MEKITLTYQGQRLVHSKLLTHFYLPEGEVPIGFDEKLAGYENIGDSVACIRDGKEISFDGAVTAATAEISLRAAWIALDDEAVRQYTKTFNGFIKRLSKPFKATPINKMKAKLLGNFIIVPFTRTAAFVLTRWIGQYASNKSVFILLDDSDEDSEQWFYSIVIQGITEEDTNKLITLINSEL